MFKRIGTLLTVGALSVAILPAADNIPWAGGPVIQNARIIVIYWGMPDSGFRQSLDRFYSQIVQIPYLNRLSEYSTGPVKPLPSVFNSFFGFRNWFGYPSEQVVGAGSFVGSYIIQQDFGGNVETTDIGPQLDHEIHVGHVPGPDRNTIYMVHFSPSWNLYLGTNILGIPVGAKAGEGFCAYHAAYYSNFTSRAIVYGAVPFQAAISNCGGGFTSALDGETAAASHELVEAVTDPGSAVIAGAFLSEGVESGDQAWRLPNGTLGLAPVEIADRCGVEFLRTSSYAGDIYLVSETWSNKLQTCILSWPVGNLDGIKRDGSGNDHVYGWSIDPANPSASIQVHLYFDGPYPFGRGYAVYASLPRPDVNSGTGYPGAHGFDFVVPSELRDGTIHSVYAYGIGLARGNNAFLSNVPITFNSLLANQPASQPVMIASGQASGQCLDITGAGMAAGTPIQLYSCHGGSNQRFTYHPDTQELRAYADSPLCVDASSGAGKDGDRLIIWPCNGDVNQKWRFNINNGEIRGINDKCVDANRGSVANGTAAQIWTCNGGANQTWFRK
jgi:hypothetical protein